MPKTGNYQLEIRDAIYRGREDFVYRIAIAKSDSALSNCYANEPLKDSTVNMHMEKETNNTLRQAEKITLPTIIVGKIAEPNDEDVFAFTGKAGDTIAAEIFGRRLDSPIDAVIRIYDQQIQK